MIDLGTAVLYPVLATALYMLGSRDMITSWLWSRYPASVDNFLACPSCSGTWYGIGLAGVGAWQGWSFLGLPGCSWVTVLAVGLWCKVLVPVLARYHIDAVAAVGAYTDGGSEGGEEGNR